MKKEFFLLLAVMALSFAAASVDMTDIINKRYEMVSCRVNMIMTLLQKASDYNVSVDTSTSISGLQSDLADLKAAADSGSMADFNKAMVAMRAEIKDAILVLRDIKKELIKQPREIKEQARADFTAAKQAESECLQTAAFELAKAEVTNWQSWRNRGEEIANNLSAKGLDTSNLNSILSEADSQIATLQAAIDSGNLETLKNTRAELREEHLHLVARFQIERIRLILGVIDDQAIAKGYQSDVDSINALLDDAAAKAAKGKPYDEGEFKQTWDNIKEAASLLRDLFQKLK